MPSIAVKEVSTSEQGVLRIPHDPTAVSKESVEMSASVPHTTSTLNGLSITNQLAPKIAPLPKAVPLSEDAKPFKAIEPAVPAVEYVRITPDIVPATPLKKAILTTPVAPANTVQKPETLQRITPDNETLQKPPALTPSIKPALAAVTPPVPELKPFFPPAFVPPSPQPVPSAQQVVLSEPAISSNKTRPIYSHNTQAVWNVRRTTRSVYVSLLFISMIAGASLIVYWISLGTPTDLRDML